MRKLALLLLLSSVAGATTYHVRSDGGTRAQCTGTTNAAYPGTGTGVACAFGSPMWLVQSGASTSTLTWIIAGGDTVIFHGSTMRIGWPNNSSALDSGSGLYYGISGDPYSSGLPPPPNGTSSAHTKLLGENFANCHAQSARTQLHGGYGVHDVINLSGASYVDVQCLDITDFSNCGRTGQASACNTNPGSLSDYAQDGIRFSNTAANITVQDVRAHGLAVNGFYGPTGDGTAISYVDTLGNAAAGWDTDDGNAGTGTLAITHTNIGWNGCAEEYPIVDALPYADCTDQNTGGYGDGFGTATHTSSPGWVITFDQDSAFYNTQDGFDALHVIGAGSSVKITRSLSYGNMGQQIKIGGNQGTVINNIVIENCNAMRYAIPGTPSGYNSIITQTIGGVSGPGFCRAADTGIALSLGPNSTLTFQNNTVYSAAATAHELDCDPYGAACDTTTLVDWRNNIFLGFMNDAAHGYPGGGQGALSNFIYSSLTTNPFGNTGSFFSNNITYHQRNACPMTYETNSICTDPLLADENWYLYGFGASGNTLAQTFQPTSSSPAIGSGATLAGVTTDYAGNARTAPYTRGALNLVQSIINSLFGGNIKANVKHN